MRYVLSIAALLILTGLLFADEKESARAKWRWATSCQMVIAKAEVKLVAKTEEPTVVASPVQSETVNYGTCSDGSCSQSSPRFSLFRRRR